MQTHTETITASDGTYTIHVGGTLDGVNTRDPVGGSPYEQTYEPNRYVRIENVGDTEVVNPWIVVNGKRDWRSLDHILAEILTDDTMDAEKARAIWEFARKHRYHFTCATDEVKDTVKMLNVYGYTLCWDEAYTVSNLWQSAGLKVRRGYPHGHCTTEVYYDGAYHLLDSDEHLLYLLRDNKTIASEADLARDRDLVKRGHAYGVLQHENMDNAEGTAALFFFDGPRTGGRPLIGSHTMDVTLRPGEALLWEWEDRGKYHGYWDRPKLLRNGRMQYEPDLSTFDRWADRSEGWEGTANGLHPEGGEVTLELTVRSPYAIVGGKVDLALQRGPKDEFRLSVSRNGEDWHPLEVPEDQHLQTSIDLDGVLRPDAQACYAYTIRLESTATDLLITKLALETDLQMAPLALPALEMGENEVRYTSESGGQVRITHAWEEKEASPAPVPPSSPCFPLNESAVPGTKITFSWPAVESATDYLFELSDRADMRYALSPVFEKLVSLTPSKGKTEWTIPFEGLLNPGQIYYWHVRPRSAGGLWGAWSLIWSFTPDAPDVPLDVHIVPDWDDRTLTLNWSPNADGNVPVHYEIHGSDERGFTASREPYSAMIANDERETRPPNLIATTDQTSVQVGGPSVTSGNCAFYRVVAVDKDGNRSGPSDFAEAPRPMIVSVPAPTATAGETYAYQIQAITALGELRAERIENQNYVREIREADAPRYLIDEGPYWTSIDEETGVFTACPEPKHLGFHTITVRIQNGQGRFDMQGFDLEVTE